MEDRNYEKINLDFIGVIKKEKEEYIYKTVEIHQDYTLIQLLEEMEKDRRFSIIDMQNVFNCYYPKEQYKNESYSYLNPLPYNAAYVGGVYYPTFITNEEYEKKIAEKKKELNEKFLNNEATQNGLRLLEQTDPDGIEAFMGKINKDIKEGIEKFIEEKKKSFRYKRFIYAANYNRTVESLQDNSIKMISTDQIGWEEPTFPLFQDLTISVRSNFGYGVSSYFFCNLKYKDIKILPYTDIVDYYYVNMTHFLRYTRSYRPKRESWKEVFEFVTDVTNMAYKTQDDFIEKWIVDELDKMVEGIRNINLNASECFKRFMKKESDLNGKYKIAQNIGYDDIEEYEILPEEKVLAFRAEKITGCLQLLENLKSLSEINSKINGYIEDIKTYNLELYPVMQKGIANIEIDIEKLNKQLVKAHEAKFSTEKEIEPDVINISNIYNKMNEEGKRFGISYDLSAAESRYIKQNINKPGFVYVEKKKQIEELEKQIKKLLYHKHLRESFIRHLQSCIKRIRTYLDVA